MVDLLVMRHAKSAWDTGALDFDRPLSERGIAAARKMAGWIADRGLCPTEILSSSSVRTRSTIEPVIEACDIEDRAVVLRRSLYLAELDDWLVALRNQTTDRLLICGHNPGLDDLVVELLGRTPRRSVSGKLMTTAAVAHLRIDQGWDRLRPGCATLVDLKRPRD